MAGRETRFLPALGFRALTPCYDRVLRATLPEERFKARLVEQAGLARGQRVLDLGCGTGMLTLLLKRREPGATIVGLDADGETLARARAKAAAAGLEIEFRQDLAADARFPAGAFDRVVSSLFFHHLTPGAKRATLARVHEWLRPGGELHVADWGTPHGPGMRLAFLLVQFLDGFESTAEHARGALPARIREAGFTDVAETHRERTLFGTLALYRARRAPDRGPLEA